MSSVPRRNISVSPTVTIFGGMKPITSMTMSRITSRGFNTISQLSMPFFICEFEIFA
jgi:hypothetical protein